FILQRTNIRQSPGTTADIAMLARRIAKNKRMWWNISCYHRPGAHEGKCPNSDTTEDDRPGANRRSILHQGWRNLPVISAFQLASGRYCARGTVVGKTDMRPDENSILQRDAFKDRDMILNLYT